jgi:hypothetical protein
VAPTAADWPASLRAAHTLHAGLLSVAASKLANCAVAVLCVCVCCAGERRDLPLAGLFFAIGHEPATAFLDGQVRAVAAAPALCTCVCVRLLLLCLLCISPGRLAKWRCLNTGSMHGLSSLAATRPAGPMPQPLNQRAGDTRTACV